jgi:hypothetical protein
MTGGWLVSSGQNRAVDEVVPAAGLGDPLHLHLRRATVAVNLHGSGPESHRLLLAASPQRLVGFAHAAVPASADGHAVGGAVRAGLPRPVGATTWATMAPGVVDRPFRVLARSGARPRAWRRSAPARSSRPWPGLPAATRLASA